jgi:hypothetical protein
MGLCSVPETGCSGAAGIQICKTSRETEAQGPALTHIEPPDRKRLSWVPLASPPQAGGSGPLQEAAWLGQAHCFDQLYETWLFMESPAPTLPPGAVSCQCHSEILAVPGEFAAGPQPHFLWLGPWPWLLGTEQPLRLEWGWVLKLRAYDHFCLGWPLLPRLALTWDHHHCPPPLGKRCSILLLEQSSPPHPI